MKTLCFLVHLLVGLCFRSNSAFPPQDYTQHASIQSPQITGSSQHSRQEKAPAEEQAQVNTVRVTCHPDSFEIIIKADMFEVGAPVNGDDLRLGVEHNDYCRATTSSIDEYRILVGLMDCGTKQRMTEDALVYTNLLVYLPVASPDGVVRMNEDVIPIECHYERKYSLSSYSLMPTWIPFMSTQAAVETLEFDLRILTNDWLYRRSSNVFYLGDPIGIEASVRVGHHTGLRVFVSSCVATLYPDVSSEPRYVFVENGCMVDSELPGSRSHFLSRTQDNKLHLTIDSFKFHNEDGGELYITCHLNAVLANDVEAPNKACSFVNGRWRSADGNDYLCGYCQSHDKPNSPGKFGPRGFEKPDEPELFWRSGLRTNTVWEKEAGVGPIIVLPAKQNSGPIPVEELPSSLNKIARPSLFGSQWRSGMNDKIDEKGLLGSQSTPDELVVQASDFKQNQDENGGTDLEEKESPEVDLESKGATVAENGISTLNYASPTVQFTVDVTKMTNALLDRNNSQI
ncbi:zona pellucida sperm-binding protein 3-like isoform X2 [Cyclopterus lumpus]|uniref:zona pellucida sperm-binding protein 3-like isoform X2 n=1 Tax=Cyclopterus lumpus TaxID=8103 RepID=UPI001486358B|nr:zona pellucida sperm-binding protein 3-like isoform X2 [Cyclopterus lumpus]